MDGYSKMLMLFRNEGSKYNPPMLLLGEMTSSVDCVIGKLSLDEEDYYISEHLATKEGNKYKSSLKAGDIVLLYPLNDEKYVIIEKVVELNVSI